MARRKILTTREAIVKVLREHGGEMTTKEVVAAAIPLAKNLKSKTKAHTVYTTMLAESKKPEGLVEQVKPGLYRARPEAVKVEAPEVEEPEATPEVEPDPKPSRKRSTKREKVAA